MKNYSKELNTLIKNNIGYRNPDVSEFTRAQPVLNVVKHEIEELGNDDILYFLDYEYQEVLNFISDLESLYHTELYALWLCASVEDVKSNYPSNYETNEIEIVDVYELPELYLVFSDLGSQGILIVSTSNFQKEYMGEVRVVSNNS